VADVTEKKLIYTKLRRTIVTGRSKPGERLNPRDLAKSFGCSVMPVRDAFQMLHQEGLVTIKPRSGYFVTHLTLKEIYDLFDLREILEMAAAEKAAGRITDAQLEELENIHAGYTGEDEASLERYADENRRLHCLIAEASGNKELAKAIGRIHDQLARFMVASHADQSMMAFGHQNLINALRTRDTAAVREAMYKDLNDAREKTLQRVIEEGGAFWQLRTHSQQTVQTE
jgi:DNA-binding GntR family transcriptional regulator